MDLSINRDTSKNSGITIGDRDQITNNQYPTMALDNRDFSGGFTDLHTISYNEILRGNGYGLMDAIGSINIVHSIRNQQEQEGNGKRHPMALD